jgi:hypothetical protein
MYYKRHELQLRVNIFFSASILAGAVSGVSQRTRPSDRWTDLSAATGVCDCQNVRRRWVWRMAMDFHH